MDSMTQCQSSLTVPRLVVYAGVTDDTKKEYQKGFFLFPEIYEAPFSLRKIREQSIMKIEEVVALQPFVRYRASEGCGCVHMEICESPSQE